MLAGEAKRTAKIQEMKDITEEFDDFEKKILKQVAEKRRESMKNL